MRLLRLLAAVIAAVLLTMPMAAQAQDQEQVKSFAVMPFKINGPDKYQYLSQGIQSMLVSRLNWPGKLEAMSKDAVSGLPTPASGEAATAALAGIKADYLVYGDATILGEQASLDVNVAGADGSFHTEAVQSDLSGLIPALQGVATKINTDLFKRPGQAEAKADDKPAPVNRMNPELLFNEQNANQEYYLNPQFRYAGGAETPGRWRSPSLRFSANGMIAADLDNDGQTELVFITENTVYVYMYQEGRLVEVDQLRPSTRIHMLNVNVIDLNNDGFMEIAVSSDLDENPWGLILNFKGGKLQVVQDRLRFYMNVVKLPPDYRPALLGQKKGHVSLFDASIHEVAYMSGGYTLGKKVAVPEDANVFNFCYLPQPGGDYRIIVINDQDRILTFTPRFDRVAETEDRYAGSSIGFEYPSAVPGLKGNPDEDLMMSYYIPLRLVTNNLDDEGGYELLVNKNVSIAAIFFPRYRSFSQGELHNMFWDGVGMSLSWKTRRIKGTVVDYGIGDVNNDGAEDLYVCVVTYPGALGVAERKTMLITYQLDLGATQSAAPKAEE